MNKQVNSNRLNGRDLINIGIYSAIYLVLAIALAMTGLIPIFLILLSSMYGIICGIFPMWACGNYLPLFVQREQYFAERASYGQEYVDAVMGMTPNWMFFVLLIMTFLCGIIGGLIGKKLLKKHFVKAGIA